MSARGWAALILLAASAAITWAGGPSAPAGNDVTALQVQVTANEATMNAHNAATAAHGAAVVASYAAVTGYAFPLAGSTTLSLQVLNLNASGVGRIGSGAAINVDNASKAYYPGAF